MKVQPSTGASFAQSSQKDQQTRQIIDQVLAVEVHGLKKSFGFKPVLRGVDIKLQRGERVALLGANGTGKTTLLRILACLTRPDAGTVQVESLDCVRDAQEVRHRVGLIGHQSYLYEELTALENLLFFARMYGVERASERAQELLEQVGLYKRRRDRVTTFSRGLLQRLAWARALLHAPHLLLLDEADTGMDQEGNTLIERLLAEHTARGGTTLFTTHHLERALQLSDVVLLLKNGQISYQNRTVELTLDELLQVYQGGG